MKKFMISVLASLAIGSSLYGFNLNLNVNFKNGYVYDQDFIAGKPSYLVSPVDINFSDIQNSLANDETVFIYPYFGTQDKINAEFGINILATIKLTKTKITYYIYDNGWKTYNNVNDFKAALENYASQITDSAKKSNFTGDYITQATSNYIIHNKLYVMVTSKNSSVKVPVPVNNTEINTANNNAVSNTETNNSSIIFPPSPPSSGINQ